MNQIVQRVFEVTFSVLLILNLTFPNSLCLAFSIPSPSSLDEKTVASFWHEILEGHFEDNFQNHQYHFFNNAGASPSPPSVLRAIATHLVSEAIFGGYHAAECMQKKHSMVYTNAARLIQAKKSSEIALVESATVGWTRIFYAMANALALNAAASSIAQDKEILERVILISEAEYAANVVAIVKFAREENARNTHRYRGTVHWSVIAIPSVTRINRKNSEKNEIENTGVLDIRALEDMLAGRWTVYDHDDLSSNRTVNIGNSDLLHRGQRMLNPSSIAMVCITQIPTNSGIINPVREVGRLIAEFNREHEQQLTTREDPGEENNAVSSHKLPAILYLVDACQAAGQIKLDVQEMHAHALTATGRKYLRGPRGTGFLYVREDVANNLEPSQVDHFSTPLARLTSNNIQFHHKNGAARFEFWESNLSLRFGLGAAISHALDHVGMEHIEAQCTLLGKELRRRLRKMDRVRIHHDNDDNEEGDPRNCCNSSALCGIVTFSVSDMDSAWIKERMMTIEEPTESSNAFTDCRRGRFELSVVPATSTPLDTANTGVGDLVRASLSYRNTMDEIEAFCCKLQAVILK